MEAVLMVLLCLVALALGVSWWLGLGVIGGLKNELIAQRMQIDQVQRTLARADFAYKTVEASVLKIERERKEEARAWAALGVAILGLL